MNLKSKLLDKDALKRVIARISHEIIEKNNILEDIILIGIETRGVPIAKRIAENIENFTKVPIKVGVLDITLYRDDLSEISVNPKLIKTDIPYDIKDKTIILVDDVIYTGRTSRAAIDGVLKLGRPEKIQLAVIVDRGHRELPIRPDYVGKNIPTSKSEIISVTLEETDNEDSVIICQN